MGDAADDDHQLAVTLIRNSLFLVLLVMAPPDVIAAGGAGLQPVELTAQ